MVFVEFLNFFKSSSDILSKARTLVFNGCEYIVLEFSHFEELSRSGMVQRQVGGWVGGWRGPGFGWPALAPSLNLDNPSR